MTDKYDVELVKAISKENRYTVFAAALCVGLIALATKSLHCLWGLLILLNITPYSKSSNHSDDEEAPNG